MPAAPAPSVTAHEAAPGLRARKKAEARALIVRTASELFARQGYAETTVQQICAAAGVSLPTLFRYFPTKADLLFHGADDVVEDWRRAMLAGPPGERLIDALRRATHTVAFATPQRGSTARLRAELAPHDPELRRKALEIDARVIGRIAEVMGQLTGLDAAADVRPFLLASCAMGAVRSAQHVIGARGKGGSALATRIDEAFDALDGLRATLRRPVHRPR